MISSESLEVLYRTTRDEPAPPRVWLAVVTCMDHQVRPEWALGVGTGEAHLIRNAGGRATEDAMRSLVVAWNALAVDECVVMQHTDCRMSTFTDDGLRRELAEQWSIDASSVEFLTFTDPQACVRDDVDRIRESPLVPDYIAVSGCICDTSTGHLEVVVADPMSRIPLLKTREPGPTSRR